LHQKVSAGASNRPRRRCAPVRDARSRAFRGICYASTRVADSSTFVALLELADGSEHPRPAIPEFGRFLEQLKD
jgi:hypothetical protein